MSRVSYPPALSVSDGPAYDPTDRPFVPSAGGGASLLVHDTFTEASNTALASHTPDTDNTGSGWTVDGSSTFTVIASGDYLNATGTNHGGAYFDGGTSHIMETSFESACTDSAVALRYIDTANYWRIRTTFASNTGELIERNANINTVRGSTATAISSSDAVWAADDGSTLTFGYNRGAAEVSYSSTLHNTSSNAGYTEIANTQRYDNFYLVTGSTTPSDLP